MTVFFVHILQKRLKWERKKYKSCWNANTYRAYKHIFSSHTLLHNWCIRYFLVGWSNQKSLINVLTKNLSGVKKKKNDFGAKVHMMFQLWCTKNWIYFVWKANKYLESLPINPFSALCKWITTSITDQGPYLWKIVKCS